MAGFNPATTGWFRVAAGGLSEFENSSSDEVHFIYKELIARSHQFYAELDKSSRESSTDYSFESLAENLRAIAAAYFEFIHDMNDRRIIMNTESTQRSRPLGIFEIVAIALGGMIGGGLAYLAANSYAKLDVYYKDEGATPSFFKRTFPQSRFAISSIGWLIAFGHISALAL